MDTVQSNVNAIKPTPSSHAFLVSNDGRVIVHPDQALVLQPAQRLHPALTAEGLRSLGNQVLTLTLGQAPYWLLARAIPGTDWQLLIAVNEAEAMASTQALTINSVLGAVAVGVLCALVVSVVVGASLRPLQRLETALADVATGDGDLTKRLDAQGVQEVARIATYFNQFVAKLQTLMRQIRDASTQVRTAAEEISAGNMDLSARTESAASSLQETAATMEVITTGVNQATQRAQEANQRAGDVAQAAERGGAVMRAMTTKMGNISATSQRVGEIVGVIDGIAFQTNILALNAAVEAARAGEAGRGFAVVAAEVRALAQRSAQAAREIRSLIESSVAEVQDGTALVSNADAEIERIVQEVKVLAEMIRDIASVTQEQRDGIAQISEAIGRLDQATQQNAALVEEGAAAAASLKQQAVELADAVGRFRVGDHAPAQALAAGSPAS
jgi:methyl-accepting chemotaxis protein